MGRRPNVQENKPWAILNVDCDGNYSTYSPELLGIAETSPSGQFRAGKRDERQPPVLSLRDDSAGWKTRLVKASRCAGKAATISPIAGAALQPISFRERDAGFDRNVLLPTAQESLHRHGFGGSGGECRRNWHAPASGSIGMTLRPGCRLAVAPRFHMPADWSRRLSIAHGFDLAGENIYPRLPWRSATNDEIGLLTIGSDESPMSVDDCVWLFHLPGHLLTAWWSLLQRTAGDQAIGNFPGVDAFVREVGEFLTFKGVPMPDEMRVDVVFNELGTVFSPWDRNGQPWRGCRAMWLRRLRGHLRRATAGRDCGAGSTWETADLARPDQPHLSAIGCGVARRRPSEPPPSEIGNLVRQYLRACPDYPPVRLMLLRPGRDSTFLQGGLVLGSNSGTEQEPAVLLVHR